MNIILSLYFIATIVAVAKSSAEADDVSLLAQSLSGSKHILRGLGSIDEKETGNKEETSSVNQSAKRMLEAGTKRLLKFISINDNESEEIFTASDGECSDSLGSVCSMSGDLVVIGAPWADNNDYSGAAYLFHLDGTEIAKLTPGNDEEEDNYFGFSVAVDEKVVVGSWYYAQVFRVFTRNGIYERTIRCDGCTDFGRTVATVGNLTVTQGEQNSIWKLFIYSNEDGELLKSLEEGSDWIDYTNNDVAMSEHFIVSTRDRSSDGDHKTIIYNNTSPDFPKITEINQGGSKIAVSSDRIVIADYTANDFDGAAWLYKTDGTLVKSLDRQDASSGSLFGWSVAITDDKVLVGWHRYDSYDKGSAFIYSAVTGEFVENVVAPDGEASDEFGWSVCASDSHYVVGAEGVDTCTGAAYLFQFSEE